MEQSSGFSNHILQLHKVYYDSLYMIKMNADVATNAKIEHIQTLLDLVQGKVKSLLGMKDNSEIGQYTKFFEQQRKNRSLAIHNSSQTTSVGSNDMFMRG